MKRINCFKKRFCELYDCAPDQEEDYKLIFGGEYVIFYPELMEKFNKLLSVDSCVVYLYKDESSSEFTLNFHIDGQEVDFSFHDERENDFEFLIDLLEPNEEKFEYMHMENLVTDKDTVEKLEEIAHIFFDCFRNLNHFRLLLITGMYKVKENSIRNAFQTSVNIKIK